MAYPLFPWAVVGLQLEFGTRTHMPYGPSIQLIQCIIDEFMKQLLLSHHHRATVGVLGHFFCFLFQRPSGAPVDFHGPVSTVEQLET